MLSLYKWLDEGDQNPTGTIVRASLTLRAVTSLLLVPLGSLLPSFETDAATLSRPVAWWARPFVRWDSVHFVNIAVEGYKTEQQAAFMPGLPAIMRSGAEALHWLSRRTGPVQGDEVVLVGLLATTLATTTAALYLHRLTVITFPSRPRHALLTALLFLFAPSRPTLHGVPYTEPFAALFTFGGMLLFAQGEDTLAAAAWAAGSAFRAQGAVLGAGFFGWRWILRRSFDGRKSNGEAFKRLVLNFPRFAFLSLLSASPFLAFQLYVYSLHCPSPTTGDTRPWCTQGLGLSYGWIQREYWDVGPFHYWTLLQLPNFLLAAPVLALSLSASWSFYTRNARAALYSTLPFLPSSLLPVPVPAPVRPAAEEQRPLTAPAPAHLVEALVPHVHLHTATTLLLVVSAHVQIALRVCATGPVVWWYAAELVERGLARGRGREGSDAAAARAGRAWVRYVEVWGVVATALWAVFLPPA
ncbi:glycosyltransferase family 76 protein [Rhodotorula graminis WP1]|uniref:GPI mannosyltransferase 2 n=1 Tax=Rhodotorula graminis (strain WP1) TaxID=578459 RepID=A0A0P9GKW6_RHOGW|nr:glycosyltransferase family 76 protein [Rhodotorula graminis WP1]KPV74089.1 glycosyltransferase family 76 protein [Rhodotorula graminis WP1]